MSRTRGQASVLPVKMSAHQAHQALKQLLGDTSLAGWTFVVAVPPAAPRKAASSAPRTLPTVEAFIRLWSSGSLAIPFGLCSVAQLYEAYVLLNPEHVGKQDFSICVASSPGIVARRLAVRLAGKGGQVRGFAPEAAAAPPDNWSGSQIEWASEKIAQFEAGLEALRRGRRAQRT
jgi:hypothetical protein